MNPIADYLDELAGLLRRRRRRRILAEVRDHLLEAAAGDPLNHAEPDDAARRAVARFGPPSRVARQFNALRRRPTAIVQRAAAVLLASAAAATLGTATVWALGPGAGRAHAHHARAHRMHPSSRK